MIQQSLFNNIPSSISNKVKSMKTYSASHFPQINVRINQNGEFQHRIDWPFAAMKKGDSITLRGNDAMTHMAFERSKSAAQYYEQTRGYEFRRFKVQDKNEFLIYRTK